MSVASRQRLVLFSKPAGAVQPLRPPIDSASALPLHWAITIGEALMRRMAFATIMLGGLAMPAAAEETTGTIQAYDRLAHVIVLEDKTVWQFPGALELPADLKAGDKVKIDYTASGDGISKINSITRVEK